MHSEMVWGVYDSSGNGRPARARRAEVLEGFEAAVATRVQVQVVTSDSVIHGVVADDGKGFVGAQRNNLPGNLGLLALKERALMAGGWYEIESQPGLGTRIEFWLPLPS
jgi:signal transduction histidine kinase